jgi:HEAT repeat protein
MTQQPQSIETLITKLHATTLQERVRAIEALGQSKDKRAVLPLMAVLDDEAVMLRTIAVKALTTIGEVAIGPLIVALQQGDDLLRTGAAKILGGIGNGRAVEALIAALQDRNARVRALAAEGLGDLGDDRAIEPLIKALNDPDKQMVARVATVLGKLRATQAVEPLMALLPSHRDMVRLMAVWALGEIGDSRAIEPILAALSEDCDIQPITLSIDATNLVHQQETMMVGGARGDSNRPDTEIAALVKIGQPAVAPLIETLKNPKPNVRAYAIWGLAQLRQGVDTIKVAADDPDPFVRDIASRMLQQLD